MFRSFLLLLMLIAGPAFAADPPITALAFHPKGNYLIAGSQSGIQVYQWPKLTLEKSVQCQSANVHDISFSKDGKWIAVAGGSPGEQGLIEILTWPELKPTRILKGHTDSVYETIWKNNEQLFSAGLDHQVIHWNVNHGEKLAQHRSHSKGVTSVAYLEDKDILVTGGLDYHLRVWDLESKKLVRSLNNHTKEVNALKLRPQKASLPIVCSVSRDKTVRFWQPTIGRMVRFIRLDSVPSTISWTKDGSRVIIGTNQGNVLTIDPDTAEIIENISTHHGPIFAMDVHPTEKSIIIGTQSGAIKRIELPKSD